MAGSFRHCSPSPAGPICNANGKDAFHTTAVPNICHVMQVQDCFNGQRVFYKENSKLATIRRINGSSGELELAFDNGSTTKAHARLVEPAESGDQDPAQSGPMRPCPQCAAKMPATVNVCPACGFRYGVKQEKKPSRLLFVLVVLIMFVAVAYFVWRFRLAG